MVEYQPGDVISHNGQLYGYLPFTEAGFKLLKEGTPMEWLLAHGGPEYVIRLAGPTDRT